MAVVPPLTDTLASGVEPTAELKVVVPVLVTVRAVPPLIVPEKVVLLPPSMTVRPLPSVRALGNVTFPVLVIVSVPPTVSERPLTDSMPVLVRLMLPLPLLVPSKLPTVLTASSSVVPPTEVVVSVPVVLMMPPVYSPMLPLEVRETFPLPAEISFADNVASAIPTLVFIPTLPVTLSVVLGDTNVPSSNTP